MRQKNVIVKVDNVTDEEQERAMFLMGRVLNALVMSGDEVMSPEDRHSAYDIIVSLRGAFRYRGNECAMPNIMPPLKNDEA